MGAVNSNFWKVNASSDLEPMFSAGINIPSGKSLVSGATKVAPVLGAEQLTNPGYETWPAEYTPAFLTGGTAATSDYTTWEVVTDATFDITIDGTLRHVECDFDGATSMDDVAGIIQSNIRDATGSSETCVWSTNHFIISSVNTTSSSAITVTSATGSGTDISGAGATAFMDCDTGNGVVTNAVQLMATDWTILEAGAPGTTGTYSKETTIKRSGNNALKLVSGSGGNWVPYSGKTGLTPGDKYVVSVYGRVHTAGMKSVDMVIMQETNFSTFNVWDPKTKAFVSTTGNVDPYYINVNVGTETFTQGSEIVVVGSEGAIYVVPIFGGDENQIAYLDDASIKPYTNTQLDVFTNTATVTPANLDRFDNIFLTKTTGGSTFNHFGMNSEGGLTTDYDNFDFTEVVQVIAEEGNEDAALNGYVASALLGSTDINLKTVEAVSIGYTLGGNKKIINPIIVVELTAGDTLSGDATMTIGNNSATYDNLLASTTLTQTNPSQRTIATTTAIPVCDDSGEIFVNVTGADSGTSGTATIYLYGTIVDN